MRPIETGPTVADATKARKQRGWTATTTFEDMLTGRISAHLDRLASNKFGSD